MPLQVPNSHNNSLESFDPGPNVLIGRNRTQNAQIQIRNSGYTWRTQKSRPENSLQIPMGPQFRQLLDLHLHQLKLILHRYGLRNLFWMIRDSTLIDIFIPTNELHTKSMAGSPQTRHLLCQLKISQKEWNRRKNRSLLCLRTQRIWISSLQQTSSLRQPHSRLQHGLPLP